MRLLSAVDTVKCFDSAELTFATHHLRHNRFCTKVRSHGAALETIFLPQQADSVPTVWLWLHYFYIVLVPPRLPQLHRMGSEPLLQPLLQLNSVNNSICYNRIQLLRQKKNIATTHF